MIMQFADRDALQFSKLLGCTQKVEIDTIITLVNEKATTGNFESTLQYLGRLATDTSSRKVDYLFIISAAMASWDLPTTTMKGILLCTNSGGPDADTYGLCRQQTGQKAQENCSRVVPVSS
jgi:hypothetical protein